MKNPIPACVHCQTNKFVQRDRTMEKVGTVAGGSLGVGAAYLSTKGGAAAGSALGSFAPGIGTLLGAAVGGATGMLLGFISGSATGNLVGERIDSNIRMRFHCAQCGRSFTG